MGRSAATRQRSCVPIYYWVPRSAADPWSSTDAFLDVVGRYGEVGIEEFILDHPRDEQLDVLGRVAADVIPRLRLEAGAPP